MTGSKGIFVKLQLESKGAKFCEKELPYTYINVYVNINSTFLAKSSMYYQTTYTDDLGLMIFHKIKIDKMKINTGYLKCSSVFFLRSSEINWQSIRTLDTWQSVNIKRLKHSNNKHRCWNKRFNASVP